MLTSAEFNPTNTMEARPVFECLRMALFRGYESSYSVYFSFNGLEEVKHGFRNSQGRLVMMESRSSFVVLVLEGG